jgi:hypothetical protein
MRQFNPKIRPGCISVTAKVNVNGSVEVVECWVRPSDLSEETVRFLLDEADRQYSEMLYGSDSESDALGG